MRFDLDVAAADPGTGWRPLRGTIRVSARTLGEQWRGGDCMRARVWLRRPQNFGNPGHFDYVGHLRRQGINVTGSVFSPQSVDTCRERAARASPVLTMRRRIGSAIDANVGAEAAAVLRALIVGDQSRLARTRWATFARAGAGHVLSISGLHFSVVAAVAFVGIRVLAGRSEALLVRGLPRRIAALFAFPLALTYAVLAGGRPPTVRAAIMSGVFLTAVVCMRQSRLLHSLALAFIVMVVLWPGIVFDPGFALSFIAVLSIALGLRPRQVEGRDHTVAGHAVGRATVPGRVGSLLGWVRTSAVVACCASLGTAPVSAYYFNLLSVVGPLTNVLVLPLYSGAVVAGLFGALSVLVGATGAVPFAVAGELVELGEVIVGVCASLPGAALSVFTPTAIELGVAYAALACPFVKRHRRLLLVAVVAAVLVDGAYWLRERYARPGLRVTFLDVGQGDAAVIEFPGSAVLVVDGGGFPGSTLDPGEAIVSRFLRSRKIGRLDFVAMTHTDADHAAGLAFLVRNFNPREFWWNGQEGGGAVFTRLQAALRERQVTVRRLSARTPVRRIGPATVEVLHPETQGTSVLSSNEASLVLRVAWGKTSVLLAADIEREGERQLVHHGGLRSTVLKVPHHGSRTSSGAPLLGAVEPAVAVFSVGRHNRYGFPHAEVEARYRERGVCMLRTDVHGAVVLHASPAGYHTEPSCDDARDGEGPSDAPREARRG
jgi:competence protein ComEC